MNTLVVCAGSLLLCLLPKCGYTFMQETDRALEIFSLITCILLFIIFIVEFIFMLTISSSKFHTVLPPLFLLIYLLISPDMNVIRLPGAGSTAALLLESAENLLFIGTELSLLSFFCYTYRPHGKRISISPILIAGALCAATYSSLSLSRFRSAVHLSFVIFLAAYFLSIQLRSYLADTDDAIFIFSSAILFSVAGMHTVNVLYYTGFISGSNWATSSYIWFCLLCFATVYISFVLKADKIASRAEECCRQNERLKMKILTGQIKPHFIFNALNIVKSGYHRNPNEGDRSLELLSRYLREIISSADAEIIPFEQELNNINEYVNFVNSSQTHSFNIIYNIDMTDFSVPVFSVQTFVENAVKYSRVNEIDGGYIMISSYAVDGTIELKISDNGVGFDTSRIAKDAHGISNACKRFNILLGTEPTVSSICGKGTEITIIIRKESADENNSS